MRRMSAIRARVQNGRLVVAHPPVLPEGTGLDLVTDQVGDALDAADRVALNDAISAAWRAIQAGQGRLASDVLAKLRSR